MNFKSTVSKASFLLALAAVSATVGAQTTTQPLLPYAPDLSLTYASQPPLLYGPKLSLNYVQSQKDTWNIVLIVSAAVLVIGIADSDSTLAIIGGAGVVVAIYEQSTLRFKFSRSYAELDLASSGPFSFGLSSIQKGEFGAFEPPKPCLSFTTHF